jgi:hypothetical protein
MTRSLYTVVLAMIFGAFLAALLLTPSGRGGERVVPHTLVTVAPGWVSADGEPPVPECAAGDDCTGPDYR